MEQKPQTATASRQILEKLVADLRALETKLRAGGGPDKIAREHHMGKLTARERIERLLDTGSSFLELGLLVAFDQYKGEVPGAGAVTGIGFIGGRQVVVFANDATVKAGVMWPETVKKILRVQEIAMRCRLPIVYLVDSAGAALPYQSGVFPGKYGGARVFYYNCLMKHQLKVPQIAAVMGPCIAGGAYMPALSDYVVMVERTSFMGLGGASLVKGATGQTVDNETLGGARTHNSISGVAHYRAADDDACLMQVRKLVLQLPREVDSSFQSPREPKRLPSDLYDLLPADVDSSCDTRAFLDCLLDVGELEEFQKERGRGLLAGYGHIAGFPVGVLAHNRAAVVEREEETLTTNGLINIESAEKAFHFIADCNLRGTPLLFVQDILGATVDVETNWENVSARARFLEALATATVPRLVLALKCAGGEDFFALAGQTLTPDFVFAFPTAPDEAKAGDSVYIDAKQAAARGLVDAVIAPEEMRSQLGLALSALRYKNSD